MYKTRYWLPLLALWIGFCILFFVSIHEAAKKRTIDGVNARQRVHAEQAARGIEDFFRHWIAHLSFLAEKEEVRDFVIRSQKIMEMVYDCHGNEIKGLTRVDAKGTILYTFPEVSGVIGRNISGQKHFRQIMATHKPVVSDVFQTVQGYEAIVLHMPIFTEGHFNGSVAALFDFKTISKRYLENIRIGPSGHAWMLNAVGTVLFCNKPDHVGRNVSELPEVRMVKEMLEGKAGSATYRSNQVVDDQVETATKYAVYMPVRILDSFWSIVVASPEDEVLAGLESLKGKLSVIIGLILFGTVVFTSLSLKASHFLLEDERRSLAEKSLRKNEALLRGIFQAAPVGLGISKNRVFEVGNDELRAITGYSEDELRGLDSRKLYFNEEDYLAVGKNHYGQLHDQGVASSEVRWRRKDGSAIDILMNAVPVSSGAAPPEIVFAVLDITERKKAEKALVESERKFRLSFDASPDSITIQSLDSGLYVDINEGFSRMMGFSREEAIGKTPIEMGLWYDLKDREKLRQGILQYGYFQNFETRTRCKDGKVITILMSTRVIPWENEPHTITVARDITDRIEAEQELRRSREYLSSVIRTMPTGLAILKSRVFTMVNERICEITGYSREELLGSSTRMLFLTDEDFMNAGEEIYGHIHSRDFVSTEHRFRHKNGSKIQVLINSVALRHSKGSADTIHILLDITKRKKTERKLELYRGHLEVLVEARTQDLKLANDALQQEIAERKRIEAELLDAAGTQSVLMREVNHRVKNNLSAIIGMLHMEQDRFRREGHASHLPVMEELICRIEGLSTVHSLLTASGWRPLNVHELCRQVIEAALKGIPIGKEVDVKVGTSSIKIGSSQAHHLTLVINELATNSMKYAFGGRDRVMIQVDIEQMNGSIRIEFRDDGPGYPKAIFLDDPTPTRIGFGLIKGITRHSLGGTVDFANNGGACATILFQNELNRHTEGGQS